MISLHDGIDVDLSLVENLGCMEEGSEQRFIEDVIPAYVWQCVASMVLGLLSCYLVGSAIAIVGLRYSSRTVDFGIQGRISKALTASRTARNLALVSVVVTIISIVLRVLFERGDVPGIPEWIYDLWQV